HKTQVFLSPEGDHYRTRLTHTLEVSQIARSIARGLRLNEDLVEAISLGHDLGHTPFGHTGERTLDELSKHPFSHNKQSLRVVEFLENDGLGLNLTYEVKDGIVNHTSSGKPKTLEGVVVSIADRIAYVNHDIDDAIRAKILTEEDLPAECVKILGKTKGERINTMIMDIITNSFMQNYVKYTPKIEEQANLLRKFMFDKVYNNPVAKAEEGKANKMISLLFNYFMEHPNVLPPFYKQIAETSDLDQAVCDYIASMSDGYAVKVFSQIFIPLNWQQP
ncbi:MAG: deoxyguanosinetriphosphate triphosphohydrolase, partial [Clostridia bacterium]